ncbi:MAG: PIN domain-containing protein [Oscillospiraceae bacterium]|jgi:predicted nucleic acid-binding protein|nr:PIN domain-containing protein [Oscillospiraceae bacterium]
MRVVIDNNIIVDALKPNTEFQAEAQMILRFAAEKKIDGYVSASSLTDIFYVLRKEHNAEKTKEMIRTLMSFTDTIPLTASDCTDALDLPMNDFEDAVVAICAAKIGADYIVSRDEAFATSAAAVVKVIKPDALLPMVG